MSGVESRVDGLDGRVDGVEGGVDGVDGRGELQSRCTCAKHVVTVHRARCRARVYPSCSC